MFEDELISSSWGHKCIIDGKVMPYGACSAVDNSAPPSKRYDTKQWEYFGTGNIIEISGVFQGIGFGPYHFYRKAICD